MPKSTEDFQSKWQKSSVIRLNLLWIFAMAYYIIVMSLLPPVATFFPFISPSCLNHPPQKEYCLLSCHASYGAASSYSGDICLEHHRKSTPIRLFSTDFQRPPSSCSCTHDSKSSRFCRAHGSNSMEFSKQVFSSTGSWPYCLSSDSGPSRP